MQDTPVIMLVLACLGFIAFADRINGKPKRWIVGLGLGFIVFVYVLGCMNMK